MSVLTLFNEEPGACPIEYVNPVLLTSHYLGPINRGFGWYDEFGVAVLANPSARHLPQDTWLELVRWCLNGTLNGGSQQWSRIVRYLRRARPAITTVVSYSDPSVGHTGGLYRACNWQWAPTWHRLRPPPSGNGSWDGRKVESVKDRWIYPLRKDAGRRAILRIKDAAIVRRMAEAMKEGGE